MNAPEKVIDLHDAADRLLHQEAWENLKWRLVEGKEVNGMTFLGLLDAELDTYDSTRVRRLEEIADVLCGEGNKDLVRDGIIERFLLSPKGREAIGEEMERLGAYDPEPMDWKTE